MTTKASTVDRALTVAVFVLTLIAFVPSLDGKFLNWDDTTNFVNNPGYRGLGWSQLRWMWTTPLLGHYIPLTWMTLGLNYVLGGMHPWGYHLVNVLLHAANAVVFYFIVRRLLARAGAVEAGCSWGAAVAALVFGVHPLRAESVAWLTERRDVLYACFFLLAVLTYLKSLDGANISTGRWRRASITAFVAALLSKSAAVTLPVALIVIDIYPLGRLRRRGWRRLLREKIAYVALAAVASVVAIIAVRHGTVVTAYDDYGPGARVAMTAYTFVFYLWKWLWPSGLSPLYELPARVDPLSWRFVIPMLAFIAITGVLVAVRKRWPAGLAAWVYSCLMLLPVSGLIHAGYQLAHDRYSYISGLGFAALTGAGVAHILMLHGRGRISPGIMRVTVGGVVVALALLEAGTWNQTKIWRDSYTLWRTAVAADPACSVCYASLGNTLVELGRVQDAEAAYRHAIALRPDRAPVYTTLGMALGDQGRFAEAEAAFQRSRELDPTFALSSANLAILYERQGRYDEAAQLLREVYAAKPDMPNVRTSLARVLRNRGAELDRAGKRAEAVSVLREADEVSKRSR